MPEDARLSRRLGIQILFDFSDIVDAVEFAAANRFGVLEINLGNIGFGAQLRRSGERRRVQRRARELKVALAIHALEGPSFFVPSARVRRCAVAELKQTLDWAADIGARNVVMHLGFDMHYGMGTGGARYTHEEFPEYYDQALFQALSELKGYARGRARLCVENVGGFRYAPSQRVLPKLLGGALGLCFDIGHITILPEERQKEEFAFFQRHQRVVYHSHIHHNHGVRDEHLPLGAGSADVREYLRFLLQTGAFLVMETRPREAALSGRDYFEQVVRDCG